MATAFSAAADDILYTTETGLVNGYVPSILQGWSSPAQPVLRQKEYIRAYLVQRTSPSKPLLPAEDYGFIYSTPPASTTYVNGWLTMVCFPSFGGCGYGNTPNPRRGLGQPLRPVLQPQPWAGRPQPTVDGPVDRPGRLADRGHTRLDGQAALELSETAKAPDPYARAGPAVDQRTQLLAAEDDQRRGHVTTQRGHLVLPQAHPGPPRPAPAAHPAGPPAQSRAAGLTRSPPTSPTGWPARARRVEVGQVVTGRAQSVSVLGT